MSLESGTLVASLPPAVGWPFTPLTTAGNWSPTVSLPLGIDPWAEEWLAAKPAQRAATLARDRAAIRTHFSPAIGQFWLPAVTPSHIRSIVVSMQAGGLSPKAVGDGSPLGPRVRGAQFVELAGAAPVTFVQADVFGWRFHIVKRSWTPDELEQQLAALGWSGSIREHHGLFIEGEAAQRDVP